MLTSSLFSLRPRPRRRALARHVHRARDRLATRVLDDLAAAGAVIGECEARVLESALALCLLDRLGVHPRARARLVAYLEAEWSAGDLDPFHHALAASVLGRPARVDAGDAVDAYLRGFEHFTSPRKRVFFTVVLEIVSGRDLGLDLEPAHFEAGPEAQRWVAVMMHALAVLHFSQRGRPDRIRDEHVASLVETTAPAIDGICDQYLLGHLLSLLALHRLPDHAAVVRRRVDALLTYQRPSGGFGFITRMEVFATATAGLGLVGAGVRRAPLISAGDTLARLQRPDGGWGYAVGVDQTDMDDTAYCVELLRALDPIRYRRELAAAERYIVAMQNPDGGFPTFARGSGSEVAMTAAALSALAPVRRRHPGLFRRGIGYILDHQRPDGTFERSWSCAHANAIFRALLALQAGEDPRSVVRRTQAEGRALAYLRRSQNQDGGWGHAPGDESDPISSAYALIALAHFDDEATLRRGVDYLAQRQRSDGGYTSRPDGAGPRPIAYDVPVLADHFALIAFNHVLSSDPSARVDRSGSPPASLRAADETA